MPYVYEHLPEIFMYTNARWGINPLQPPARGILALLLLVFRVCADDHHLAVPADDLAFFAHRFDRRTYFHGDSSLQLSGPCRAR